MILSKNISSVKPYSMLHMVKYQKVYKNNLLKNSVKKQKNVHLLLELLEKRLSHEFSRF